jgi:hypothetical protein
MKLGDLIYPAGVEELGFRIFGAVKGALGALLGMTLWQIGSRIVART